MWKAQWVDASKELPIKGRPVFGMSNRCVVLCEYGGRQENVWNSITFAFHDPTWWAYLPPTPEENVTIWHNAQRCVPLVGAVLTYSPNQYYIHSYHFRLGSLDWQCTSSEELRRPMYWMHLPAWPQGHVEFLQAQWDETLKKALEKVNESRNTDKAE